MSSNICGNCGNFKLTPDKRFFDCTVARHADLSYGMQVRPDTSACDAFMSFNTSSQPVKAQPIANVQSTENSEAVGLCTLGQKSIIAAVVAAIVLVSWLLYTCARM